MEVVASEQDMEYNERLELKLKYQIFSQWKSWLHQQQMQRLQTQLTQQSQQSTLQAHADKGKTMNEDEEEDDEDEEEKEDGSRHDSAQGLRIVLRYFRRWKADYASRWNLQSDPFDQIKLLQLKLEEYSNDYYTELYWRMHYQNIFITQNSRNFIQRIQDRMRERQQQVEAAEKAKDDEKLRLLREEEEEARKAEEKARQSEIDRQADQQAIEAAQAAEAKRKAAEEEAKARQKAAEEEAQRQEELRRQQKQQEEIAREQKATQDLLAFRDKVAAQREVNAILRLVKDTKAANLIKANWNAFQSQKQVNEILSLVKDKKAIRLIEKNWQIVQANQQVNQILDMAHQDRAAKTIQSNWKLKRTQAVASVFDELYQYHKAASIIQQQVRRHFGQHVAKQWIDKQQEVKHSREKTRMTFNWTGKLSPEEKKLLLKDPDLWRTYHRFQHFLRNRAARIIQHFCRQHYPHKRAKQQKAWATRVLQRKFYALYCIRCAQKELQALRQQRQHAQQVQGATTIQCFVRRRLRQQRAREAKSHRQNQLALLKLNQRWRERDYVIQSVAEEDNELEALSTSINLPHVIVPNEPQERDLSMKTSLLQRKLLHQSSLRANDALTHRMVATYSSPNLHVHKQEAATLVDAQKGKDLSVQSTLITNKSISEGFGELQGVSEKLKSPIALRAIKSRSVYLPQATKAEKRLSKLPYTPTSVKIQELNVGKEALITTTSTELLPLANIDHTFVTLNQNMVGFNECD